MTANPNRSLRDVVLQRQVWSYLKTMLDNDIVTTTHEDEPSVFNEMQQPPKKNTHTFEIDTSDFSIECAEEFWSHDEREEIDVIDMDLECSGAPRPFEEVSKMACVAAQVTTPPSQRYAPTLQTASNTIMDASITPTAACRNLLDVAQVGPVCKRTLFSSTSDCSLNYNYGTNLAHSFKHTTVVADADTAEVHCENQYPHHIGLEMVKLTEGRDSESYPLVAANCRWSAIGHASAGRVCPPHLSAQDDNKRPYYLF